MTTRTKLLLFLLVLFAPVLDGGTGDWVTDPPVLSGVLAGQANTIHNLNPQTSYEMRWVSVGYDSTDTTPGPSTVFTTTPIEVDALIRNLGDTDYLGEHIYNRDGTDQSMAQYAAIGVPAKYEVQVRNTSPGGTSETVTVHGPASDAVASQPPPHR